MSTERHSLPDHSDPDDAVDPVTREHLQRLYENVNLLGELGYDSTGETQYEDIKAVETEVARLRAENERLRDGYCDEAYILMVQALDVKALPKGRKRILTEQALRMAKVGLGQGWPRPQGRRERLHELAADVLAQLAPASDEDEETTP